MTVSCWMHGWKKQVRLSWLCTGPMRILIDTSIIIIWANLYILYHIYVLIKYFLNQYSTFIVVKSKYLTCQLVPSSLTASQVPPSPCHPAKWCFLHNFRVAKIPSAVDQKHTICKLHSSIYTYTGLNYCISQTV